MEKELIYIADPMCSWCWGFSPVIHRIADALRPRGVGFRVLPGGLRTDVSLPLAEYEVAYIMDEWRKVAQSTGQPFDFDRPLDSTYVYNTGPSCVATSLMNRARPQAVLDFLTSLQQAFYVGRRDLKDPEVLADYAHMYGLPRADFLQRFHDPEASAAFDEDLHFVRRCGIEGYPSVLIRTGQRIQRLTIGYQTYEALVQHLQNWLEAPVATQ